MTEAFVARASIQCDFGSVLEDFAHTFARLRRAFEIVSRADAFGTEERVFGGDDLLVLRFDAFVHRWVVAQVTFVRDEKDGNIVTEMLHLGRPFVQHTRQTVGRIECETDENDLSVGIAENTQSRTERNSSHVRPFALFRLVVNSNRQKKK